MVNFILFYLITGFIVGSVLSMLSKYTGEDRTNICGWFCFGVLGWPLLLLIMTMAGLIGSIIKLGDYLFGRKDGNKYDKITKID